MYTIYIKPDLKKTFHKLSKKNPKQFKIIMKKLREIVVNPYRYKNLKAPLNDWKRVHIDSSYVLAFSIDEDNKQVVLEDYDHHDNIYRH